MDITKEIPAIKQLCKELHEKIQEVRNLEQCHETKLAIIKLQEAVMWLDVRLKQFNF